MNDQEQNLSLLNVLLLAAILLTLALLLLLVYKGWKEEHTKHSYGGVHSGMIANITVNLGGIPYQEHCITCHAQGRSVIISGASTQFQDHPDIAPHSMEDLGCTGCHLGEGMARDLKISHGRTGTEAGKTLAGADVQASCYRCHDVKPLPGGEKAWEGYQLFSRNACGLCHSVDGREGGTYGPDLSNVGSLLGLKQIQTAIDNPKEDLETSIMPKFPLAPEEVTAMSYYLKSRMKESFFQTPMQKKARIKEQERAVGEVIVKAPSSAKEILRGGKCLACHKYQEEDGQIAPDLSYTASMRQKDYVRNFLHSPGKEIPGAIMPWIRMNRRQEDSIIMALQRKSSEKLLHGAMARHIYMEFCQRCHAAEGDGFGTIQPNLANFPRAFLKNTEFFRRIADNRIVNSIQKGIPGTSMPPYGNLLQRDSIDNLIDLLFSEFIHSGRGDKEHDLSVPPKPATLLTEKETTKKFNKYCSSCHGVSGKGKGPDYLKYLPRPRDLTNRPYFTSLNDKRIATSIFYGIPGTGMHPFYGKISDQYLWSMVMKIRGFSENEGNGSK